MRTRREHRRDIQGLRAVAVLLVIGDHAGVGWLSGGFVGVDVFFVISGYLITLLLVREAASTGRSGSGSSTPAGPAGSAGGDSCHPRHDGVRRISALSLFASCARTPSGRRCPVRTFMGIDYFDQGREPSPVRALLVTVVEKEPYSWWPRRLSSSPVTGRRMPAVRTR